MHSSLWDGWISLSIDQKKDDFSSSTLWSLFLGSWLSRTGSSVVKESQIWARLCLFPAVLLSWLEELAQSIVICLLHQGLWEIGIYFSLTQLSWFNFCSVEYRRSFHRQWVTASCISYSISPLTRQDLHNCTKAISYQSSFLPPCLISLICACQEPHRCFHVT